MSTPTRIIATDFLARSVALKWPSRRRLAGYPAEQYRSLLQMLDIVYARKRYARLIIDPPRKVLKVDFCRLPIEFLLEQISGDTLDLSDLKTKLNRYREMRMRQQPDVHAVADQSLAAPVPFWQLGVTPGASGGNGVTRPDRYLLGSRLITLRRRNSQGVKVGLTIEMIKEPAKHFEAQESDQIVEDLLKVFSEAWSAVARKNIDPAFYRQYIKDKYWAKAEKLAVLRNGNNRVVGFACLAKEVVNGQTLFWLVGTVLHPSLQGLRLSVKLNQILVVEAWRENAHLANGRITLVTRTANPRVIGAMDVLENLAPNPWQPDVSPPPERVDLVAELCARWTPDVEFDRRWLVARAALAKGVGGLLYHQDEIQAHRDPRVNNFCRQHLDNKQGDLFQPIGDFTSKVIFRLIVKSFRRALGAWWRWLWLSGYRRLNG